MVTSIVSSITKIPINKDIAMTGEVTITGQVLPIGGLKEKLLAAHRAGIKEVLIPKENNKDLADIPKKVKDDIKITTVETADEVLKIALTKEFKRVEWTEVDKISESKKDDIKITTVETADEVLKIALTKDLKSVEWVEVDSISDNKKSEKTPASIQ